MRSALAWVHKATPRKEKATWSSAGSHLLGTAEGRAKWTDSPDGSKVHSNGILIQRPAWYHEVAFPLAFLVKLAIYILGQPLGWLPPRPAAGYASPPGLEK